MAKKVTIVSHCFSAFLLFYLCGTVVCVKYNTGASVVPGKLNVHLIAHSHDDVGWLKTVDQYYVGSNNSIQGACVENVLDSVVVSLQLNQNRKFVFAEMAFFHRWWVEQTPQTQVQVRKLVDAGQLEFINGGWCMHDEATTHYIDMIDQTTLGHRFIKNQFNKVPRAGWQIDPFGHSAVQAYLLGAELGFDSVHFARIDYQDRAKRKVDKTLEVVWRSSKTFGSSAQIFANAFPVHYSPPSGFHFEINDDFVPVQDDPLLFDYNVEQRVKDFIAAAITQDGRVNALYSTPSIYTDAKNAANQPWPLKTDDYFPYADGPNAYWTGYFTSRPAFKRYVRILSGYYLAARQLEFFAGKKSTVGHTIDLGDALGVAQHHDAVSGTAKQHTTNDYAKRLAIGASRAETVVSSSLYCLTSKKLGVQCSAPTSAFSQVLVVYNPLGWNRSDIVRIPVNDANLVVKDSLGNNIETQYIEVDNVTANLREFYVKVYVGVSPQQAPKYWLLFQASVPPLGWSTYFISKTAKKGKNRIGFLSYQSSQNKDTIEVAVPIQQSYLWYSSSQGEGQVCDFVFYTTLILVTNKYSTEYVAISDLLSLQDSGAYIFRPHTPPNIVSRSVPFKIIRGPLVDEVHQEFSSWIYQVTRVYKDKEHAEIEYTIGPIPIEDGIGKEVITQMTANMVTDKEFYTDSNGRDFLKRLNLGIYVKDKKSELSVLVDRATGGGSIKDGQVELMLHRRMLFDDGRGVDERLDELVCQNDRCQGLTVRGNYYVGIHKLGAGSHWRRTTGQEVYSPLLLAFAHEDLGNWKAFHVTRGTVIDPNYNLPPNVALITLEVLDNGMVLLRLAHLYEAGEDAQLSTLTKVELKKMFATKMIRGLIEVSLSANQEKEKMKKKTWNVAGDKGQGSKSVRGGPVSHINLVVELGPMEIRSFLLKF
ncbi:hypothetical protein JHK87_001994 [Glycine soja]|nr:hypothetical protein JHK87_001994 [Glycine soja]